MAEKRLVYREGTPKKVAAHNWDASDLEWANAEAERKGISRSAVLRRLVKEARARKGNVPEILRGDCRIVHLVNVNRVEDLQYLNSSGIFPPKGAGAPFSVPHDAVGGTDEFIEQGLHSFDPTCCGCRFLAASRMLPPVLREG